MYPYKTAALSPTSIALVSDMPHDYERAYVYFEFATDAEFNNLVVPSAGTITVLATDNGFYFGTVVGGDNIAVNTPDYFRVSIGGIVTGVSATPTGLAGAPYWRMIVARYK